MNYNVFIEVQNGINIEKMMLLKEIEKHIDNLFIKNNKEV